MTPALAARARATSPPRAASRRRRVRAETAAFWAVEGLRWVAAWLPERLLGNAAVWLGDFVFYVIRWRRRVAAQRVARAWPRLSQAQQHRLVRASYEHLALALLWFLRLPRLVARDGVDGVRQLVEIDCETHTQLSHLLSADTSGGDAASSSAPRSAIVTTGHIGLWELLPMLLASQGVLPRHTQWIVYRPLHNAPVNALVEKLRAGDNRELIADKNCFRTLVDALTSPTLSLVGLVADQRNSHPKASAVVRFLGQATYLSTGPTRLHEATQAPLWFAALVFNYQNGVLHRTKPLKLVLSPISLKAANNGGTLDVQAATQAYADALEATVTAYPSQYLWIHDLWTHRARDLLRE